MWFRPVKHLGACLFSISCFAAAPVMANTISVGSSTLTCTAGATADPICVGFTAADTFPPTSIATSAVAASLFGDINGPNVAGQASNEATEAAFLNMLAGTSFGGSNLAKTENPLLPFNVSTLYFILKLGSSHAFFRNETGGAITFNLTTGPKEGLSHVTLAGSLSAPVPIPGAVWLFGSGLLGLGAFVRRNRRQAKAA